MPAFLNGTYRFVLTQADADKVGDTDTGYPTLETIRLKNATPSRRAPMMIMAVCTWPAVSGWRAMLSRAAAPILPKPSTPRAAPFRVRASAA